MARGSEFQIRRPFCGYITVAFRSVPLSELPHLPAHWQHSFRSLLTETTRNVVPAKRSSRGRSSIAVPMDTRRGPIHQQTLSAADPGAYVGRLPAADHRGGFLVSELAYGRDLIHSHRRSTGSKNFEC